MASINDYLPREVLVKIFSYYMESEGPLKFLRNVSPVCKLWNDLCPSYPLWKEVSLKSLEWNSDHLLKLGERGFLTSTRTLNLSCETLTLRESEMIEYRHEFKIEYLLQLIDCCHSLKVLDIYQINFTTETTLQFIARKCPEYEQFIVDSSTHKYEPKYKHSEMVPIDDGNKIIMKCLLEDIQKKRRLDVKSRFAHDCKIISKIADCCPFLEELRVGDVYIDKWDIQVRPLFPVGEIQKGCPKLRVLRISNFKLDFSNYDDLEGFKEIRTLSVLSCDFFRDQDVGKIFKNSTKLENLQLFYCHKVAPEPERPCAKVTFPVGEIQRGCPKLRVLTFFLCDLEWSNDKELEEGFKEIRTFSTTGCDFRGVDVGRILKNSAELENLELSECSNRELAHANEIPSEKIKSLLIHSSEELSEQIEKMVKRWKLTLKRLVIYPEGGWCPTRILKALLQDSQNTVIETIALMEYAECVDAPFIKSLIHDCQKLRYLHYIHQPCSSITLNTRQKLEEYAESL